VRVISKASGQAVVLAVAASLLLPSAGEAADKAADQPTVFDPVIVTARKRSEEAQTVPISISAYDQGTLERLGVRSLEDLRYVAPSVYVAQSTFRQDTLNITIRGQRNFESTGLQFDTAAAVYVDGVYYARPVGLTGALFDVDSLQVLKGPQGTLVGRNSTGGAILYESRQPSDSFGGYARLTAGDYGRAEVQGAVNLPLNDQLFLRAAVATSHVRGYIANDYRDPATGYVNDTPGMGSRKVAGLFSMKWRPDDSFSLLLRASFAAEHDTGAVYHDLGYFEGTVAASGNQPSVCNIPGTCTGFTDLAGHVVSPYYSSVATRTVSTAPGAYNALLNSVAREQAAGFWSTEQAVSNYDVGHYQTWSAVADKTLGGVDVKLSGAYRAWNTTGVASSRGLPYATNIFLYATPDYRSYQSELTINGQGFGDRLKWTTGLFFFRETSPNDGDQLYLFLPSGNTPAAVAGKQITYTNPTGNDGRNTSYAAYAQATYAIGPDTRLTAGVRYTVDQRFAHLETQTIRTPATAATTATVANGVFDPSPYLIYGISYPGQTHACALTDTGGKLLPLAQCSIDVRRTFRKPTWTLALDHDLFARTLVYATARSGYRAGAINSAAINPAVIVARPERVRDYEIGVKSDWRLAGVPVRTNLAAYYTDYRDIQIQTSLPNVTIATSPGGPCSQAVFNAGQCVGASNDNVTLNARAARVRGFEWEITAKPLTGLTLATAGSYLDAVYTDYSFTPPPGYLLPTGQTNLSGTPFPLPKWQASATATYALPGERLGTAVFQDLTLTARVYRQSRNEADLRPYNALQRTSANTFVNLRLDLTHLAGRNVDLSAFATNLFDTKACLPEPQGVLNSAPNGTFGVAGTSGVLQCVPREPRMYGATVAYSF
jgi:iron complex outermembrane receptor protein